MKKNKWTLMAVTALAVFGLAVSSCKKTTTPAPNEETGTSADNATAEHTVSDLTMMAAQSSDGSSGLSSYREIGGDDAILGLSCATVMRDTTHKIITVTFNGSTPCLDGKTRSGSVIINYSGCTAGAKHYRDPGFSCTVSTNAYVVNGYQVNVVNKTVTNTTSSGFNPMSVNETWSITANVNIVKPGGGTISWNCNRTKTLLNTSDTSVYHGAPRAITWSKAKVGLTGSASGTCANGNSFTANVASQLVRDFTCNVGGVCPFIQGVLDFTPTGHPTRVIDYGPGTCDLDATVTVNGVTTHITL